MEHMEACPGTDDKFQKVLALKVEIYFTLAEVADQGFSFSFRVNSYARIKGQDINVRPSK